MFLKYRQVLSFGCFVFEIWVLRASDFVFETTACIDGLQNEEYQGMFVFRPRYIITIGNYN